MPGLTVVGAELDGRRVGIRAVDGLIAAIGAEVVAEAGDEVLDGTGRAALPGLVNGHPRRHDVGRRPSGWRREP